MASSTAPSTSLYVGDLSKSTTESTLYETFSAAGSIASVRVCRDTTTRQSLGYAYVNFHRPEDAERAFDTLNFKLIDGKPCRIMWTQRDPTLRKNGMGNVFIKNLAKSIDQKQLYDTFSIFGNILSCKVAKAADGTPLGYGFVHYDSEASANAAIAGVDGKLIEGSQVSASAFRSKEERESANKFTNVYVKNIPDDWTDPQLRELFAQYGQITSSLLLKGFGFVNFQEHDQATQAIQGLQGHTIGEKKLFVGRAKTKDERNKELHERRLERERSGANLYIKNLSDTITDESLKTEFTKFGKITSAKIMTDGHGNSRGFGFISFSTRQEATHAVAEMNGRMVSGKPLYVGFAQKKDQRKQQLESQFNARGRFPPMIPPQYYPQQMYYPPGYPQGYMYAAPPQGQRGGPQQFPPGRGYPPQYRQQGPPRGAMRAAPKPQQPQLPQDKQALGEQLYPLVKSREPEQAGKITGMLLEMEVQELHELLSNDQSLEAKIREALAVLQEADQ